MFINISGGRTCGDKLMSHRLTRSRAPLSQLANSLWSKIMLHWAAEATIMQR